LLGGGEGRALVQHADTWMRGCGVVDPERYATMLTPGLEIR
jgi:hypothetical protein